MRVSSRVYFRVLVLGREGPQDGVHLRRRAAVRVILLSCYTDSCMLAVVDGFTTFGTRADDRKVMWQPIFKGPPIIHIFVRSASGRQRQGRLVATQRTGLLVGVDAAHARLVEAVTAR